MRINEDLFSSLFRYRPRPNREPLEDYVTEAAAYFLRNDIELLRQYLNKILHINISTVENSKIDTQCMIESGHIIDMVITWISRSIRYTLFLEHKINSVPWEFTEDGKYKSQIDEYCKYQDMLNRKSKKRNNFVALMSKYSTDSFFTKRPSYIGNFTWDQLVRIIERRLKNVQDTEKNHYLHLEEEFIKFMRRNGMAGFENLKISELSSIKPFASFSDKINALNSSIIKVFNEDHFKRMKLKKHEAWGHDKVGQHYGIIYHNDKTHPEGADLWVHIGLSTSNPPEDNRWYPDLIHKEEVIPDLQVAIYMYFDSEEDANDFICHHKLNKKRSPSFELLITEDFVAIIKRKSLIDFLKSDYQENDILKFLENGLREILSRGSVYEKIITNFQES